MGSIAGRCLCGAVGYDLARPPERTTICYCRFCQRSTGGAQMILAVCQKADLRETGRPPSIHRHVSEGSGKQMHIHFCAACGTKLYVTFERWPDAVGLFSGTLDDPAIATLDPETTKQIFVASARPGTVLHAGLPTYWQHATTPDGAPEAPFVLEVPTPVEALGRP